MFVHVLCREATDVKSTAEGQLLVLCSPCSAVHVVDPISGEVIQSLPFMERSLPWVPRMLGLIDNGEVLAILGHDISSGSTNVFYLCSKDYSIHKLGMPSLAEQAAALQERAAAYRSFDVSLLLTWPIDLMDANKTCCYFGNHCSRENCKAAR